MIFVGKGVFFMSSETEFSKNVHENIHKMENMLRVKENFDILEREIVIAGKNAGFFFIDGFVQEDMVEKLMQFFYSLKPENLKDIDTFLKNGMPYTEINRITKESEAVTAFLSGISLVFIDGFSECIGIDCRTYPMRSVAEPWKDRVLRGSRDGFVETLVLNAALLRRRIRDPKLSLEMLGVGTRSRSDVAICYMQDKVDEKLLSNIRNRIKSIKVEALTMNIESLAECLYEYKWINPFPKFKYSERPDTAAAAILDGNIVIMVDNSPAVMILPTCIFDIVEEADDYNFSPVIGTYLRISRFLLTIVTMLLTPTWLLLIDNPHWLPEWLKFITVSDDITVPVFFQLILLELAIDGLKLAAVNTPTLLSTPLSVIAGIVVGEYAVSSGWFNAESMLYMAVVSIGTYSQASFEMGYAMKFMRIILLCLTGLFNLPGYIIGVILIALAITFNRTMTGLSYIYPVIPFDREMFKRKVFRIRLPHEQK
jgi:stage V sporulation protein AF